MIARVRYSVGSHVGLRRSINQDNYSVNGRIKHGEQHSSFCGVIEGFPALLAVFDGMGGEERGEEASLIAAKTAAEHRLAGDPEECLEALCFEANRRICRFADENGVFSMGTTAAMLGFDKDCVTVCNIGDSRIYRMIRGRLIQISEDHVSASFGGRKPPLSQNLGIPEEELEIEPYTALLEVSPGDEFLICSDGLTDMVGEEQIAETLLFEKTEDAADKLITAALENGGRDNVTVIVCRAESDGEAVE